MTENDSRAPCRNGMGDVFGAGSRSVPTARLAKNRMTGLPITMMGPLPCACLLVDIRIPRGHDPRTHERRACDAARQRRRLMPPIESSVLLHSTSRLSRLRRTPPSAGAHRDPRYASDTCQCAHRSRGIAPGHPLGVDDCPPEAMRVTVPHRRSKYHPYAR